MLDKATGTLQYSEIEGGRILRVEPRVRSIDYKPVGGGAADEPAELAESARQKRRHGFTLLLQTVQLNA